MYFLAKASMKNRALIALVTIVVAIFGGLALTNLKQELAPSVQFPQLAVLTVYPGAAPEVVNQDVSGPIETAIQGVPGIENTTATSSTNLSLISVSFTYGTDLIISEQKINQAINRIKSQLPSDVDPQVISGSFSDFPVMQIAVSSDLNTLELADILRSSTLAEIKDVEGVRDAILLGAPEKRVTIEPNQAALQAQGLTSAAIKDTLDANGLLIPAGEITENDQTLSVQIGERINSVDAIAALPITGANGPGVVTIGSVSSVALTDAPTTTLSRVNGKPALTIAVTKLPAANTVDVSKAVNKVLPTLETSLGNNAVFTTVFDQAPYIEKSIESLTTEGLLGLLFAVIIILIFLVSIRSTLVTAISIPTSVLITFIGLQAANYTLNILTLGALTIAIGRVVDDSIVVIENIKRRLVPGVDRAKVIVDAVREVAGAITASTATTVAVFLPLAFVGDITGELFRPFALTVTIALVASLLVSLTIVPVLAYWFLRAPSETGKRAEKAKAAELAGEEKPGFLQKGYLPVINWTLKHSVTTIILAVLVLVGTGAILPLMKTNFLGSSGQNTFTVTEAIKPGTSLEAQDVMATDIEGALLDTPGVEIVQVSIGSSGNALRDAFVGGGDTAITFSVTTKDGGDQQKIQDAARAAVEKVADKDTITVGAQSGFGASSDIAIDITAPNQAALDKASAAVDKAMRALPAVKQVTSNLTEARPYIAVTVNRDDAAAAGFSEVALAGYVAQAMRPTTIGTVVIEGTTLDIYIASNDPPTTEAELAALTVPTAKGLVLLDTLATVTVKDGPATVTTVKGQRSATVTVTPNSEDLGTATAEVTKALKDVDLPSGASAKIGGVSADQAAAFSSLGIALLVAILVVYIIMVATFGSLLQPLLLLISVPFAATGAIGLQVITGVPLGVPSFIGLLMLVGIVVTNAIVLIDLVNQYRNKGLAVAEALREGAIRRLRPILMTALATIFALIPMAVGITGSGGFISQPLAIVVIGGLISSTALTLIVLPTIYNLVEGGREKRKAKRAEKKAAKAGTTASAPVSKEPVFDTLVVEDDGDDDTPIRRRTPSA
ncbi:HAE1 family hydrophobic/amphiphilic exporter-1 [Aurantimicrobium minutum]|uniref:efflux RND transporter permease subunit n=1 Tax=Aurantimicrobium minutum TaxID=708131 RepID=UPI003D663B41|nr:HAE1 family hydrophobic/amphiphilic exporter-1 [Aurantimicrobium minutum]